MRMIRKNFTEYFSSIMYLKASLLINYAHYNMASNDNDKTKYLHMCQDNRSCIIDIISSINMYYLREMEDSISHISVGDNIEVDDLTQKGLKEYANMTLETFLHHTLQEIDTIHNNIVLGMWLKTMGLQVRDVIEVNS